MSGVQLSEVKEEETPPEAAPQNTSLYRCYCDGVLVYVGISKNLMRRLPEHERKHITSVEVDYFATRAAAKAEESRLIEASHPVLQQDSALTVEDSTSARARCSGRDP